MPTQPFRPPTVNPVFYSVRSERMLMEQIRYNMLFRWFVGLAIDDPVWDHSVFSKNRDRLLEHEVVEAFFAELMKRADAAELLSREHFSVDGALIQARASHKSFKPRDGDDDQPPAARAGMRRPAGGASCEAMTRTPARPIRMPGSTARVRALPRSWPPRNTC